MTYLSDLTEVNVDAIDVMESRNIWYFEMWVGFSLKISLATNAVTEYMAVVTKTKDISWSLRPPDVTNSRTSPYNVNEETIPTTQNSSHQYPACLSLLSSSWVVTPILESGVVVNWSNGEFFNTWQQFSALNELSFDQMTENVTEFLVGDSYADLFRLSSLFSKL